MTTKLPFALYLPDPEEPAGVLIWGKAPEQKEADLAAGIGRVGGHRSPNYAQAYLLAANTLIEEARGKKTLDHHVLPIFFLQRHAAELLMKEPLQLAMVVQRYREKANVSRPNFPDKAQAKRAEDSHNLQALLADLKAMAQAMQVGTVPAAMSEAVGEILSVEQHPTWARYSYHLSRTAGSAVQKRHMEQEIAIPVGEIQNLLQAANNGLGSVWSFVNGLIMGGLGQQLEGAMRDAGELD
jgi:hypothetical protein